MSNFLGETPKKPEAQIIVELGGAAGSITTRYHAVIKGGGCVVLVYDTRYQDGNQWAPSDMGSDGIKMHCPSMDESFTISSMGLQFSLGVLDVIVLIQHEAEVAQGMPPVPKDI
jgi:hypothetical protein